MSTIKISQLPYGSAIQANTQNTIFAGVDLFTGTTYAYSAKVLATGLYSNTSLIVGQNQTLFPNTIAQFSLSGASYVQTNFVNLDGGGSADHVITANNGTDSTYFLDLGLANPAYQPGFEYNNIGTSVSPLDGYLYVQGGTTSGLLGGNLIVGTTTTGTQIKFIVAGGTSSNIVAKMNNTGLVMNGNTSITTSNLYATGSVVTNTITTPLGSGSNLVIDPDGTADVYFPTSTEVFVQSTNDSTGTGSGALQVAGGISVTGNVYSGNVYTGSLIATGNVTAQTLTMNGSISVTGGIVTVNNNTFGTTVAAMRIDGSAGFAAQPTSQSGTMMQVIGLANTPTRIIVDSYSTSGNAYSLIAGRQARGTAAAPTASQSGDVLARYSGNGYGATGYSPLGIGRMDFVAAENYTDANKGSYIQFAATPIGSNVMSSNVVTISATGLTTNNIIANTATVGGNTVATFVTGTWTPNVIISGATIAYTSANGSYTKIGRQVTAYFTLIGTQNGTSATVSLGNLPFASNTGTGSQGVLTMGGPQAMPGTFGLISGNVVSNSTSSALYCLTQSGPNFGQAAVTGTILGSTFTLNGMVTYISAN